MNKHTPVRHICKSEAFFMSDFKSKPECFLQNPLTDFGIKIYPEDPIIPTMKTIIAREKQILQSNATYSAHIYLLQID